MTFPKNIYQVWFQGCENITSPEYIENIKNWKEMNPTWKYQCLNESDLVNACKQYSPEALSAYNNAKTMHCKIDFGKCIQLYLNGGIMIDMDMYALRSLDYSTQVKELIAYYNSTNNPIIGLSKSSMNMVESYIASQTIDCYGNAVIICSPRNPILGKWIERIIKNINTTVHYNNIYYTNNTSGPVEFNKFLGKIFKEHSNESSDGKIIVFDYRVFEPCDANHVCNLDSNTISLHAYSSSWLSGGSKEVYEFYTAYKFWIILVIVSILSVLIYKKYYS